ncbi:MAG: helix-turn-helix domain-containing protein [Candidatus Dormibacteria bacterium]
MSGPSDPFAYDRPTPRSSVSAARLPIISGRPAPDADDQMPLLFDDAGLVSPRKSGRRTADMSRRTGSPTPCDTSHTSLHSHERDLLRQRPWVTSDSDQLTSSSIAPMLLTVRQVEAALQLGRTRTYELLRSGQLPTLRVGRLIRVSRVALEEWIARQVAASDD